MKLPNPWVGLPVSVAAIGGATVGFVVTTASCAPDGCVLPAVAVALAVGTVAAVGVGVVVVLALRSLSEFHNGLDRDILTFVDTDGLGATTPTITEADESHIEAISAFLRRAWQEAGPDAPGWTGASDVVIAELSEAEAIRERIGGPDRRTFVASGPDGIVGLAGTRRLEPDVAELAGIIVLQSMVGSGVGTPLLELTASTLATDGVRRLVVKTEVNNDRALRFYRGRGFSDMDRTTHSVEGADVDVVLLERQLGP